MADIRRQEREKAKAEEKAKIQQELKEKEEAANKKQEEKVDEAVLQRRREMRKEANGLRLIVHISFSSSSILERIRENLTKRGILKPGMSNRKVSPSYISLEYC